MRRSVKRKASKSQRKAKRQKTARKRVKRNARARARGKKGKIDKAQSIMLRKLQNEIAKFKPELQVTRFTSVGLTIPAAAVSYPDSQFVMLSPVAEDLKPAGDDSRDTAGGRGWVEGQQIQPISTFHRITITNTNTSMDNIRVYFVLVDCKKMGGSDIQTLANLKASGNPKYLVNSGDWGSATDIFATQGISLRAWKRDEEKTTEGSVNLLRRAWMKLLAVREFHLPGNNNGHRNHIITFSHGYKHKEKWTMYNDQQDGATNLAPSAGKMVLVYATSRNGFGRLSYTRQFKYRDV